MYTSTIDPSLSGSFSYGGNSVPQGFYGDSGFASHAAPRSWPVTVSVEGIAFSYQLTNDDLYKVFSRYGSVVHVDVVQPEGSCAFVYYANQEEASKAISALDGKELAGVKGHLKVGWGSTVGGDHAPEYSVRPDGVRKFTCRFEIGIDNDRDFQVARRIIGQKGINMKNIVSQTDAKLRLRGRGSGYLEGLSRQESPEPLHLCISCTTKKGYADAIKQVSDLLEGVYEEYRQFCNSKGIEYPQDLRVTLKEHPLSNSSHPNSFTGLSSTPSPLQLHQPLIIGGGSNEDYVETNPYLVTPSSTAQTFCPPVPQGKYNYTHLSTSHNNYQYPPSSSPALGGLAVGIPGKTALFTEPAPQIDIAQKENIMAQAIH